MGYVALTSEPDCLEAPVSDTYKVRVRVPSAGGLDSNKITAGVLIFLTVLYVFLVARLIGRRLWFDELFTYYIAQSPTLARLFDAIAHTDLNPPLIYLLVRLFHSLFGASEIVTRLPAALAFYLGFVRKIRG
jgi:4-amino-4-deoxy-L-arabinose transferase-like glycosyltransferase